MIWGVLNSMLATSIWLQGGNYSLVALYALTSFITGVCIVWVQGVRWTPNDTVIAMIAILCMVSCFDRTAYYVTIVSTIATLLGCIPQFLDIRKNPDQQKHWPWIGFGLSHICSIAAGTEWSIPERFYPACCLVSTAMLISQIIFVQWKRSLSYKAC